MDGRWTLVDDTHPKFNRWQHDRGYYECFRKNENPNLEITFEKDPYRYRIRELGLVAADIARDLDMSLEGFNKKLNGEYYFTLDEISYLNNILGFEEYGTKDVRYEVGMEYWVGKRVYRSDKSLIKKGAA